jgi:glycosyltransferase involved in cell wall biosynthesis
MNNKTIVLTANTSWYLYNFRGSTISRLIHEGFDVICFSPRDNYSENLINLGTKWYEVNIDNKGMNPIKDFITIIRFYFLLRKIRPLVLFSFTIKNNLYGTIAGRLAGIPSIINVSGLGTAFISKNSLRFFISALYKIILPLAWKIYCQNPEDLKELKKISPKLINASILPGSGVNIEKFSPKLREHFKENDKFSFLYIGRIIADKGIKELINAICKINQEKHVVNLFLYGFIDGLNLSSISKEEVNSWHSKVGINWMGKTDRPEIALSTADCLVLPSYREGMPKSILEALSMKVPVIASDVPGCNHVISHMHNGILFEVKNVDSIVHAMQQIMSIDIKQKNKMLNNGRQLIIDEYSEEIVINSILNDIGFVATMF